MLFAVIVEPEGQRIRREREVLGQVEPGGKGVGEHVGQREGFTFSLATVNGKVKTSGKTVVTEQGKPVTTTNTTVPPTTPTTNTTVPPTTI